MKFGNLCIIAHNYNNNKFFSKINKLKVNSIISIYDLNGVKIDYEVYKNYEVDFNNMECINQQTNNQKEITLITCNNSNDTKRIVIKAKEKR